MPFRVGQFPWASHGVNELNTSTDVGLNMSIEYTSTPTGFFVQLNGKLGSMRATIHRPEKGRAEWRLCFAGCSGKVVCLQGKVRDFPTFEAVNLELSQYAQELTSIGH